jgi:hypothetical protein
MKKLFAAGIIAAIPVGFIAAVLIVSGLKTLLYLMVFCGGLVVVSFALAWAMHTLKEGE